MNESEKATREAECAFFRCSFQAPPKVGSNEKVFLNRFVGKNRISADITREKLKVHVPIEICPPEVLSLVGAWVICYVENAQ